MMQENVSQVQVSKIKQKMFPSLTSYSSLIQFLYIKLTVSLETGGDTWGLSVHAGQPSMWIHKVKFQNKCVQFGNKQLKDTVYFMGK